MRSRAAARSVAAMRPSLLLRLTAAAGATAAVLAVAPPARAADAIFGGSAKGPATPIVVKADPEAPGAAVDRHLLARHMRRRPLTSPAAAS